MKTLTIKQARAAHPLASAVLKQLGGGRDAIYSAIDASSHGANSGFPGFTYYTDTSKFAIRHRAKIAEMAHEMSEELATNSIDFVKSFACLKNSEITQAEIIKSLYTCDTVENGRAYTCEDGGLTLVRNAMAWFALEEVGHALASLTD